MLTSAENALACESRVVGGRGHAERRAKRMLTRADDAILFIWRHLRLV
jgi:hypothetical protein